MTVPNRGTRRPLEPVFYLASVTLRTGERRSILFPSLGAAGIFATNNGMRLCLDETDVVSRGCVHGIRKARFHVTAIGQVRLQLFNEVTRRYARLKGEDIGSIQVYNAIAGLVVPLSEYVAGT